MKGKLLFLGASALSFASAFAEGESSGGLNVEAVTGALDTVEQGISGFITSALPTLVGIASAFLAFWLGKIAIRLIKSFGNAGK